MAISNSSMPRTAKLYTASRKIDNIVAESKSRGIKPEDDKKTKKTLKHAAKEKEKLQFRLNFEWLLGLLLIVTLFLAFIRAVTENIPPTGTLVWTITLEDAFKWLFEVPAIVPKEVADFATILAPFLAISVAIERLLETAFNWFEQSSRAVADVLVAPKETLDWIGQEYQEAYKATSQAAETVSVGMTSESLKHLEVAEERLAKAEERLRGWTQAPEYLAWKKALSIWFGLLAGLAISVVGDLGMLRYIGLSSPRLVDMIVTGLVIGSGPGPMHDLIGILQGGKTALNSLSDLAKGKSVREAVEAVRREEALRRTPTE